MVCVWARDRRGLDIKVGAIDVIATIVDGGTYALEVTPPAGGIQTVALGPDATLGGAHHTALVFNPKLDLGARAALREGFDGAPALDVGRRSARFRG